MGVGLCGFGFGGVFRGLCRLWVRCLGPVRLGDAFVGFIYGCAWVFLRFCRLLTRRSRVQIPAVAPTNFILCFSGLGWKLFNPVGVGLWD